MEVEVEEATAVAAVKSACLAMQCSGPIGGGGSPVPEGVVFVAGAVAAGVRDRVALEQHPHACGGMPTRCVCRSAEPFVEPRQLGVSPSFGKFLRSGRRRRWGRAVVVG